MAEKTQFKIQNADVVKKLLTAFPYNVRRRVTKQGVSRAASKLATMLRRDAPRGATGELRRSIKVKRTRSGAAYVGLRQNQYYKLLDLPGVKRRGEDRPWFEASIDRHASSISQIMITEIEKALYREAGKSLARSKSFRGNL